ncbi:Rap1a/Tai family immunity protein [Sphingomonas silueang]|uniref:Rap1a/Tai family immunity protein n=1 Tax=Sphingomonas silueang TaxID=3156617 RepID=UPI0032B531AF
MVLPALLLAIAAPVQNADSSPIGFLRAGELETRCQSNVPASASYCFAYLTGVYDTVKAYEAWLNAKEFCTALRPPQGDLRRIFLDHLEKNPAYRSGEASSVVVVALRQRFPCAAGAGAGTPAPSR